jgi:hypothetical protein
MTRNVPTGAIGRVREQGVSTRNIFLGANGIDLVLNLVVFLSNCQDACAMNRAVRDTHLGEYSAQLVPNKIGKIKKQEEAKKHRSEAAHERSTIASGAVGISHRLRNLRNPVHHSCGVYTSNAAVAVTD